MQYRSDIQKVCQLGPKSYLLKDLSFEEVIRHGEHFLQPAVQDGEGFVYQLNPTPGMFLSVGDWKPYIPAGRQYEVDEMFIELYLVESGDITLIQNGKKAFPIPQGVNVYLNKPSKGRLCYGSSVPIKYVSIMLYKDFIKEHIENDFSEEDFAFAETFHWKARNYNTPEVILLFLQLKQKLLAFEKSRLYYESKVGELLSIVMSNFRHDKQKLEATHREVSAHDLAELEKVKSAIDRNVLHAPDTLQLCRLAAMGKTKLRESFKAVYHIPLGEYIRQAKMKHGLILLSDRSLSVQAVASHLGYASASKFAMAFKKLYGVSPEDYRKSTKPEDIGDSSK